MYGMHDKIFQVTLSSQPVTINPPTSYTLCYPINERPQAVCLVFIIRLEGLEWARDLSPQTE